MGLQKDVVLQGDTFGSILASVQVNNICKKVESSGYGYMYKDILPISILALVDDMIGVTKVGFKAQQMNAVINAKTAEKRLQFGVSKCKTMLVGVDNGVVNTELSVDKWITEHKVVESEEIEDAFSCNECTFKVKTQDELSNHTQRNHTDQKGYCNKCDFKYTSEASMLKHIHNMHIESKYNCKDCEYTSTDKFQLNNHIKKHKTKLCVNLVEKYEGKAPIEKTQKQKYLGFYLSSKGDNMANISEVQKKAVWVIKRIINRLDSLKLKQYYFECALIFLNVILRSSILYASETYYNLKEKELRALERIEENYLRRVFKTSKGCPISQLYLEIGHIPARFEIYKMRCMFLKTILNENSESMIYKFIMVQYRSPTRGDWVSSCLKDLAYLNISITLEEIQLMQKNQFKKLLQESIKIKAFQYLVEKRGRKGVLKFNIQALEWLNIYPPTMKNYQYQTKDIYSQ